MKISPSPWSFDLEFLVRSLERQYKIINHKIVFSERAGGETKTNSLSTSYELAKSSLILRFNSSYSAVQKGYNISRQAASFQRRSAKGTFIAMVLAFGLMGSFVSSDTTSALDLSSTLRDTTTGLTNFLGLTKTPTPQPSQPTPPKVTTPTPVTVPPQPTETATSAPSPAASTTTTNPQPQSSGSSQTASPLQSGLAVSSQQPQATRTTAAAIVNPQTTKPYDPYSMVKTSSRPTIPYVVGFYAIAVGLFTLLITSNSGRVFSYLTARTFI